VFLVWVYYSAQILLFGAELTQVYARRFGSRIMPSEGAISVSEQARANEGAPHRETIEQVAANGGSRQPVLAGASANGTGSYAYTNGTGHTNDVEHTNGAVSGQGKGHANGASQANGTSNKKRPRGDGGTKGAPDAVKKVLWAGLVSGTMALGTIAARRASAGVWRVVLREDPPTKDV
jgi:hypothetical protein